MPGLDVEDFYESDSSDNDENYSRLLNSVSQLDSTQRVKPAQRKEVASEVSEFNLSQGSSHNNLVNVKELAEVLGKKTEHAAIRKKFKNVTGKSKTLPKPLEKPVEERLKRSVGFENVRKQLGRWDAIVSRNALSDHLSFPLNNSSVKLQKTNEFLSQFKTATPLEEEIAKVLKEDSKKEKDEDEEEDREFPLTLEEMLEKRKEMAQLRAKLSYRQSKAQRQSKIKSKKYHRMLKREKLKQQLKEFEILQKTDPEAALKKLSELDKTRAQERASLRHRNTGQWARNLAVRAKYDVETRKVLAEQLKVSRELTQKVSQLDESDDEDAEEESPGKPFPVEPPISESSAENPWALNVSKEVEEFVSGYKKFWSEQNKETKKESNKISAPTKINNPAELKTGGGIQDGFPPTTNTSKFGTETPIGDQIIEPIQQNGNIKSIPKAKNAVSPLIQEKSKNERKLKSKKSTPQKTKTSVSIQPTSGVWIVTESEQPEQTRKRKAGDIDTLFDELNEKLVKKAEEKVKKIQRKLNKMVTKKKENGKSHSDEEIDLTVRDKNAVLRPDMDDGLLEGGEEEIERTNEPVVNAIENKTASIDPKNFIQIKPKRLRTYLPESGEGDDEALDDEKEQEKMMEEAFGDDDVVAEFDEMKKQEEQESKVEVETSLPGWGSWGGTGIAPKRKKKMLVLNLPPRKDKGKKDVIINENENPNLKKHLVKDVPHPFNSVEAFESHIRAPIGRDWVPETAHQKLIQRPIVTKLGTVIEPMKEDEIVRLKKAAKSPYQGKKKKKQ